MKRIALLMGSFNPIHMGHIGIAGYVVENNLADEAWFVVSPQNPFKEAGELAPFDDRYEMVRLALEEIGDERLKPCDVERNLPQPSYTIYTIQLLQNRFKSYQFFILIGSDVANELHAWKNAEELQKMVRFLIYSRNNGEASPGMENAPQFDIDATSIRAGFASGNITAIKESGMLPVSVYEYICYKHLYAMKRTIQQLNELIASNPAEGHHYYERGRLHYQYNDFGKAMNDFERTLELNPEHTAARQMRDMVEAIFNFRNFDIYNA